MSSSAPPPKLLRGWESIRKPLGVFCVDTAMAYARENRDPLPVFVIRGVPHAVPRFVEEWHARRFKKGILPNGTRLERVERLCGIGSALSMHPSTVLRLEKRDRDPLPLQRTAAGLVWAYRPALRDWLDRSTMPFVVHDQLTRASQ